MTPSALKTQVFLMNYPLSVSNAVPNNVWMDPAVQGGYDLDRAGKQWLALYRALSWSSIVYVLPGCKLQDLPFVANVACYLPHRAQDTIVLANFASEPRRGEELYARRLFSGFDYLLFDPPHHFEGEADLKWVRDNIYVGGIGRSSRDTYSWMRDRFSADIIDIQLTDPKLYHLDCVFLPLGEELALVNVSVLTRTDIKKLERVVEVVPVPKKHAYDGWTNSLRIGNMLYHSPNRLTTFDKVLEEYDLGLRTFDLSEFDKSGADLSCLVMHLNYRQPR